MPSKPIHPGEILEDELKELNMSASAVAEALSVPVNRISQIIAGKRSITADTALRLGKFFGTGPQLWMNLQVAYELDKARSGGRNALENVTPLSEMRI